MFRWLFKLNWGSVALEPLDDVRNSSDARYTLKIGLPLSTDLVRVTLHVNDVLILGCGVDFWRFLDINKKTVLKENEKCVMSLKIARKIKHVFHCFWLKMINQPLVDALSFIFRTKYLDKKSTNTLLGGQKSEPSKIVGSQLLVHLFFVVFRQEMSDQLAGSFDLGHCRGGVLVRCFSWGKAIGKTPGKTDEIIAVML